MSINKKYKTEVEATRIEILKFEKKGDSFECIGLTPTSIDFKDGKDVKQSYTTTVDGQQANFPTNVMLQAKLNNLYKIAGDDADSIEFCVIFEGTERIDGGKTQSNFKVLSV